MNNSVLGIEQTSTHKIYKIGMLKIKIRDFKNELKNYDLIDKVPFYVKDMIINSTKRFHIFSYSICRSKYKEGRIMSSADKKVSSHQIKNASSASALVTGKNKSIKK